MTIPTIEEANEAATVVNPPPGKSLADEQTAVKKGDFIAHYNHWTESWHVKRVVKAGKPSRSGFNNQIRQSDINYVSWDAQPEPGKSGASRSHYPPQSGFGQIGGTYALSKDGKFPWYLIDMASPRALDWIAEQDQLWAEQADDRQAEEERVNGTPEAFHARMERRARQIDAEADRLHDQAKAMWQLAEAIRTEVRGRWVK